MSRLRPITVHGERYRWRFDKRLVVVPLNQSSPQLYVAWGWQDWLEPEGPGAKPHIVTPSFVAAAIEHARGAGWEPFTDKATMHLWFNGTDFIEQSNSA